MPATWYTLGGNDSPLREYSNRQWAGLIKGYYKPRWEMFFNALQQSLNSKTPFDDKAFESRISNWEWNWVHRHDTYTDKVRGNSVEVAERLFKKYDALVEAAYK